MKSKTGNKLLLILLVCFTVYMLGMLGLMTFLSHQGGQDIAIGDYEKVSIDNTPEFILTDKSNGCRYVYNSVQRTSHKAVGSDNCMPLQY